MRRGFKADAERRAISIRTELGLEAIAPLDPWAYAKHVGVLILPFDALKLGAGPKRQLLEADPESWSGMTLVESGITVVILNPVHAKTRQSSTLMHELAHILLKHKPARVEVSTTGLLLLSDYSDEDEEEADSLAATLLLPRSLSDYRL